MKNRTSIHFDTSKLSENLKGMEGKLNTSMLMYANTKAQQLEDHMKTNRPWTDRTNQAKQTLSGSVKNEDSKIVIQLAHGVEYGIWLELANEKKYAIVEPTVRLKSSEVFDGLQNLFNRLGG